MAKTELKPYIDVNIRVIVDPSPAVLLSFMKQEGYEHIKECGTPELAYVEAIRSARSSWHNSIAIVVCELNNSRSIWGKIK